MEKMLIEMNVVDLCRSLVTSTRAWRERVLQILIEEGCNEYERCNYYCECETYCGNDWLEAPNDIPEEGRVDLGLIGYEECDDFGGSGNDGGCPASPVDGDKCDMLGVGDLPYECT